jgi:hypothetical protein
MPYQHSVAVAISVVWWGLFWAGFGTWLGALVGMLAETAPAASSQRPDVKADRREHAADAQDDRPGDMTNLNPRRERVEARPPSVT